MAATASVGGKGPEREIKRVAAVSGSATARRLMVRDDSLRRSDAVLKGKKENLQPGSLISCEGRAASASVVGIDSSLAAVEATAVLIGASRGCVL